MTRTIPKPKFSLRLREEIPASVMSTDDYFRWNIEGAAQLIASHPDNRAAVMEIYTIHKNFIRTRGMSGGFLIIGDERLAQRVKVLSREQRANAPALRN